MDRKWVVRSGENQSKLKIFTTVTKWFLKERGVTAELTYSVDKQIFFRKYFLYFCPI